jgi:hypothetical protein
MDELTVALTAAFLAGAWVAVKVVLALRKDKDDKGGK